MPKSVDLNIYVQILCVQGVKTLTKKYIYAVLSES